MQLLIVLTANPSALLMQAVASLHEMGRSHGSLGLAKIRVLLRRNNTVERCTLLDLGNSKVCHGVCLPLGIPPAPAFAYVMPFSVAHQDRCRMFRSDVKPFCFER